VCDGKHGSYAEAVLGFAVEAPLDDHEVETCRDGLGQAVCTVRAEAALLMHDRIGPVLVVAAPAIRTSHC